MFARIVAISLTIAAAACQTSAAKGKPASRRIDVAVTEKGFEPEMVTVKKGEPVTLVITRKTDSTCAKEVVIQTSDTEKTTKPLPLGKPVEVNVKFGKTGALSYACGMGHVRGMIHVE